MPQTQVTPPRQTLLRFLYHTVPGRMLLRLLRAKWLSAVVGAFLDTPLSRPLVAPFLRQAQVNLEECETTRFRSFNACFTRKLKPELRPFDHAPDALSAPCDGLLSVYPIVDGCILPVKQCDYTIAALLRDEALARQFRDGYAFVFRLCVTHYHRYAYPADGTKCADVRLNGTLHTVRPIALERVPVFCENAREYTILQTEAFGAVVQMEVGAMLVGRIANRMPGFGAVGKGEEKGMFLYGGSTVILLTERGAAAPMAAHLEATRQGRETEVRMGQRINRRR